MGAATLALDGQVALVTGGARRVGAEIVRHLHAAGASVAIHCHRSLGEAEALAAELDARRAGSALVCTADLLQSGSFRPLVGSVVARLGGLAILVNNASTFYPTPLASLTATQWTDLIGTNLTAPLFLAQAAADELRRARGLIVNIADIHGLRPLPRYLAYSTAKAALIHLTRGLARELAPQVRVNAVAPGPVMWPEDALDAAQQQEIVGRTLLQRAGTPADVARAVCFFAADAPYVTGQVLSVDGGRSQRW
ncbi:MAG: pteridine reductase [Gammaproteobacteria bacterium]|nr:pteridine reductase [Gammaproteobacteria bacterium]MDE2251743.1 pteridine reductase [Gammaproteobacteria bacterium]